MNSEPTKTTYAGRESQYFERDKHISLQVLSGRTLESQAQEIMRLKQLQNIEKIEL